MTGLDLLQIATGVLFVTTGARKIFVVAVREKAMLLFDELRVPWALWPTMLGEFLGGIALVTGVLPRFAAAGLFVIMLGAYVLDVWPKEVWAKHNGEWSHTLSNALCTPEAQLLLILAALVIGG